MTSRLFASAAILSLGLGLSSCGGGGGSSPTPAPPPPPPQNSAPTVTTTASADRAPERSVVRLQASAQDADNDTLTYAWLQVGGPDAVSIASADASETDVTLPEVTGDELLTFQVTVSDGEASTTSDVSVTAENITRSPSVTAEFDASKDLQFPTRPVSFTELSVERRPPGVESDTGTVAVLRLTDDGTTSQLSEAYVDDVGTLRYVDVAPGTTFGTDARAFDADVNYLPIVSESLDRVDVLNYESDKGADRYFTDVSETLSIASPCQVSDRYSFDPGKSLLSTRNGLYEMTVTREESAGDTLGFDVETTVLESSGDFCTLPGGRFSGETEAGFQEFMAAIRGSDLVIYRIDTNFDTFEANLIEFGTQSLNVGAFANAEIIDWDLRVDGARDFSSGDGITLLAYRGDEVVFGKITPNVNNADASAVTVEQAITFEAPRPVGFGGGRNVLDREPAADADSTTDFGIVFKDAPYIAVATADAQSCFAPGTPSDCETFERLRDEVAFFDFEFGATAVATDILSDESGLYVLLGDKNRLRSLARD